jgi:peptide chain release factor subunit 1
MEASAQDKQVEMWKVKKLIKSLQAARGCVNSLRVFLFPIYLLFHLYSNGTSMISLIIPPKDQIPRIAKMLADEYGTASNIKSRVNR